MLLVLFGHYTGLILITESKLQTQHTAANDASYWSDRSQQNRAGHRTHLMPAKIYVSLV